MNQKHGNYKVTSIINNKKRDLYHLKVTYMHDDADHYESKSFVFNNPFVMELFHRILKKHEDCFKISSKIVNSVIRSMLNIDGFEKILTAYLVEAFDFDENEKAKLNDKLYEYLTHPDIDFWPRDATCSDYYAAPRNIECMFVSKDDVKMKLEL